MPFSGWGPEYAFLNRLLSVRSNRPVAYLFAVALVIFAAMLRWALGPADGLPFITFFPAVTIAVLLGGLGPGMLAVLLSAVIASIWFIPAYDWGSANPHFMSAVFFVSMSAVIVGVVFLLHKAVDRLAEQERNIRTLIDAMPAGIVVVDTKGRIQLANPSASKLFGYDVRELHGKNVDELLPPTLRPSHDGLRKAFLATPEIRPMGAGRDLRGLAKNGQEVPVEIGLAPLFRQGEPAVLATVVDISERHRAQQQRDLLSRELIHRTQNLCAVIQAIARRTLTKEKPHEEALEDFLGRIRALSEANRALAELSWKGASLAAIIDNELSAFPRKIRVDHCEVFVTPQAAQDIALVVHELATNAVKYGAWSTSEGMVNVRSEVVRELGKDYLTFRWEETGGPRVRPPTRKGFGSTILVDMASRYCEQVQLDANPTGLRYMLRMPLPEAQSGSGSSKPADS